MKRPRPETLAALLLVLVPLAVFARLGGFEFVNYDDQPYVTANPYVSEGWTWEGFRWAWTTTFQGHWHPITWLSHMTDVQLFGLEAGAHHLTSVVLHLASTLLLFAALRRMTGAVYRSAAVAALFALHPLHVETVAWIADRKDVLCGFFWMLTLWCYARYVERPGLLRYALVLVPFGLGLASKSMIMTLPAVLLLLDFWPLGRLRGQGSPGGTTPDPGFSLTRQTRRALGLFAEKLPLFAGVASVGALTLWAMMDEFEGAGSVSIGMQVRGRSLRDAPVFPVTYLFKTLWPTGLAIPYPYEPSRLRHALAAEGLLLLITIGALYWRHVRPYLLAGWLWFLGSLVPVIGLLQSGPNALADRYTYVPLVGLFLAFVWGTWDLLARGRRHSSARGSHVAAVAVAALSLGACVALSWVQVGYWRDNGTLFGHSVRVTRGNYEAHHALGFHLQEQRRFEEAIEQFHMAMEANPRYFLPHFSLGQLRIQQGDYPAAVEAFRQALAIDPTWVESHSQLGVALQETGDLETALDHFRAATWLEPSADRYYNVGQALHLSGKFEEAVRYYRAALDIDPHHERALEALSTWLSNSGTGEPSVPF